MPKKKRKETPEEQAARFRAAVQKLVEAGELDPAEADAAFERAMKGVAKLHRHWIEDSAQGNPEQ
jgi:thiamine biosynthesis lipoprotein ApbE